MSGIPTGDWSWIDDSARRFELAWRNGPRPRMEAYLAKVAEPQRPLLLGGLLRVERELRQRAGEKPTAEEYLRRFPDYQVVVAAILGAGSVPPVSPSQEI